MSPKIDRLLTTARVNLPGAVDAAIKNELFQTLKDFFFQTNCWTETLTFTTVADQSDYVVVPTEGVIIRLEGVTDPDGRPVGAAMPALGTVRLLAPYTPGKQLTATLVLTVSEPVTSQGLPVFPDWVLDKYESTILAGILFRMMGQPAKPYSSERMAIFYGRTFASGVSVAISEVARQNANHVQAWRFPQSFATRRYR
ncbi:hypothetical protein [Phenylobacterium sp.]|uniref:hypothetical protein n=1 Tax=Phenylobacterium sp. TaxID=1871053 RepID=UPI0025E588E3|nr:hypothetical protein [Phenylobacterium sp.]MCA6318323.1 hypothetical protein [Phenylobacterium sp.]